MSDSERSALAPARSQTSALRTARLLFAEELDAGIVHADQLDRDDVRAALEARPIPNLGRRWAQRAALRWGKLGFDASVERYLRVRRAVLGDGAEGEPRLLIRVDEFPHARAFGESSRYGSDAFLRFHAILADAGIPYLLAVLPWISRDYLDPSESTARPLRGNEIELLNTLRGDGVSFALHGHSHQVRDRRARSRSAMRELAPAEVEHLLLEAMTRVAPAESSPRVFVPPFNHFDAAQYPTLAHLFDVICGGPETVAVLGFQHTPQWRGEAVYLPSYPPLYGRAGEVVTAVEALAARRAALWAPIVLHWEWEHETALRDLQSLVNRVGRYACSWDEFLGAVHASR